VTHASYRWLSKLPGDGGQPGLTRRLFLASAVAPVLSAQKPELSSFDLSLLDQPATPNDLFFVRDHFPTLDVTSAGWTLTVGGAVATPLEIPFDDLASRPRKALGVTLECAENPVGGGLVSHAEWSGVSLASILQAARPAAEAGSIRLDGADGFSRVVPLAKAMGSDVFVTDRAIDVHVTAIRKKLGGANWLVHTVRGVGYRLQETLEDAEA